MVLVVKNPMVLNTIALTFLHSLTAKVVVLTTLQRGTSNPVVEITVVVATLRTVVAAL